jgi:hypothetical protein
LAELMRRDPPTRGARRRNLSGDAKGHPEGAGPVKAVVADVFGLFWRGWGAPNGAAVKVYTYGSDTTGSLPRPGER